MDAHRIGTGAAHDAWAGLLLRRTCQGQEHGQHHHVQLRRHGCCQRRVGAVGVQPLVCRGERLHRRPGCSRPNRDRCQRHRQRHSDPAVRHIPDDVRHYHSGADRRRVCRAVQVHDVPGVPGHMGHHRLCPDSPLGMGGRLDRGPQIRRRQRRPGLRRRHGRSYQRWRGGRGGCPADRQEA